MYFRNFLNRLSEDYTILQSNLYEDTELFNVADTVSIFENSGKTGENLLYFLDTDTHSEDAAKIPSTCRNLIWIGKEKPAICSSFVNWAQIDTHEPQKLLVQIRDILLESYQTQSLYISLLHTLLNGRNISTVLSSIAEKAGSTLVVIDMSGKVLASSTPFRLQNTLWLESVERGYCPPDFIEHIRDVRRNAGFSHQLGATIHLCEDEALYYLLSRIIVDNSLFGYVFMIQESDYFAVQYQELLPLISHIIADTALKNQDQLTLRSRLQDNILTDILDGISDEQALSRIRTGGIDFPEHMCVITVRPLYYHGKTYLRTTLLPMLTRIFPTGLTVLYQRNIILILPQNESMTLLEEEFTLLQDICERERLLAGISNPFSSPAKLREYYMQALKSCSLSQRMDMKGSIHYYRDLAFYDMIDNLPKEQHLNKYCHPALATLREQDQQKGTHLYETLKVYTLSGFNQNAASEQLFLHRNTMNYRRQRIEELTGLNLEDADTRFLLQYSFLVDTYLEHSMV